jgi:hypothetical protein
MADLSNLFLPIFIILQVIGMGGYVYQQKAAKPIIPFFLILFVLDLVVLFGLSKVQSSSSYKTPGDMFADLFGSMIWTVIASIVLTVLGMVLAWQKGSGKLIPSIILPVAVTAVFYLALWVDTLLLKKKQ